MSAQTVATATKITRPARATRAKQVRSPASEVVVAEVASTTDQALTFSMEIFIGYMNTLRPIATHLGKERLHLMVDQL